MNKLKAVVSGAHRDKPYNVSTTFSLMPSKIRGVYTLNVETKDRRVQTIHYVDVNYYKGIDLEKLARVWIADYFGNTVNDIQMEAV